MMRPGRTGEPRMEIGIGGSFRFWASKNFVSKSNFFMDVILLLYFSYKVK